MAGRVRIPALDLLILDTEARLAFLDGELEKTLQIAQAGLRLGDEQGIPGAAGRTAAAVARAPLILLGRHVEALAQLPGQIRPDEPLSYGGIYSSRRALYLAMSGRREEAANLLHEFLEQASSRGELNALSASVLTILTELSVLLGDREMVERTVALLEPAASLVSCSGSNLLCVGRQLGAAAALLGRPNEAGTYYRQAIEICTKVRFRPELALTRLELAELLLAHYPDERTAAIDDLDFAIAEFREMKMRPWLERALRHKELLKA